MTKVKEYLVTKIIRTDAPVKVIRSWENLPFHANWQEWQLKKLTIKRVDK